LERAAEINIRECKMLPYVHNAAATELAKKSGVFLNDGAALSVRGLTDEWS
jgi:hypothetical protein